MQNGFHQSLHNKKTSFTIMIQTDRSGLSATVLYKASNDLLKLILGSGAKKTKKI